MYILFLQNKSFQQIKFLTLSKIVTTKKKVN